MRKLVIFIGYLLFRVQCAKILGVFPAPGYSQFILAEVLMKELANRGHEVTVISPYRPNDEPPNYKTILTDEVIQSASGFDLFELDSANLFTNILTTYLLGNVITENTLKHKKVQELLHSDEHFDLVILEQFFNDAMKGFAAHFKAPMVLLNTMSVTEWNKEFMGDPMLPSINAVSYTSYTNQMKFFQRVRNLTGMIFDYLYRHFFYFPTQEEYLKKYFPDPIDFDQIIYNASLMLANSHVTTSENVLLPYNIIEIGGFHVVQNPLSKDVQEYLDKATDGAILFSLGSNLRSADLSQNTVDSMFKVFGKIKQKILWKFEKDLPNKPENILIAKWLEQRDILAHPNIRLFITHGGMLSTTEAVFHGVPMVGIPVFADQRMNMARAKSIGIANVISLKGLSEESVFQQAINETINNPRYMKNARQISDIMRDRAVKPLDLAMYWIEYTIRHKGMRFEAPTLKLYWFELYMIDILGFLLLNLLIVYVVIKYTCTLLKKHRCKSSVQNNIKKKQH